MSREKCDAETTMYNITLMIPPGLISYDELKRYHHQLKLAKVNSYRLCDLDHTSCGDWVQL
ncbi:MAG: hypothetical protein ACNA8W_02390 [Bradymonadaceae bacterium]